MLATRSSAAWLADLAAAEIPCGRINTFADLRTDPQLAAIGFFRTCAHPSEGELEVPDPGVRIDRAALPLRHPQPRPGEHGVAILHEAGMDADAIAAALAVDAPPGG